MDDSTAARRSRRLQDLFDAHHDDVWRYAARRVGVDDASSIASETFLVAWRSIDRIPQGSEARPWLFGVARRCVANHLRGRQRHLRLVARAAAATTVRWPDAESGSDVRAALAKLGETDRELLLLIYWDGLSHQEAATVLGISSNAVGIRVHRARRRLRDELDRERKVLPQPGHVAGDVGGASR